MKKQTSEERKKEPVYSGVFAYFPRALRAISRVSYAGNLKHNPGKPLHWAHEKSCDQPDCVARHNLTPYELDDETGEYHVVHAAWRQLAWVEMFLTALEEGIDPEDFRRGKVDFGQLGAAMAQRSSGKDRDMSVGLDQALVWLSLGYIVRAVDPELHTDLTFRKSGGAYQVKQGNDWSDTVGFPNDFKNDHFWLVNT